MGGLSLALTAVVWRSFGDDGSPAPAWPGVAAAAATFLAGAFVTALGTRRLWIVVTW